MKEITIKVPDNYELKQDGNTYTIVKKKEEKLTYEDIVRKLFENNQIVWYIGDNGDILKYWCSEEEWNHPNNGTSKQQLRKLLAINKLMNVAKYLNDGWQPNWIDEREYKYSYSIQIYDGELQIRPTGNIFMEIYFKSEEVAKQAIEILGEDTIRLALCTDY